MEERIDNFSKFSEKFNEIFDKFDKGCGDEKEISNLVNVFDGLLFRKKDKLLMQPETIQFSKLNTPFPKDLDEL